MSGIETEAVERLAGAASKCPDRPCNELEWDEIVKVSDFHVLEAARCQAKVAAPDPPFKADIFNTYKTIALGAYPSAARGASPTAAVSEYMKRARDGSNWIGAFLRSAPSAVRVQTAVRAITWLTRTLGVLGDEEPARWSAGKALDWRYPGYGLMLRGKVDLVQATGAERRGVVVSTSPSEAFDDKAAFVTALFALSTGRELDELLVVVHSTGERLSVAPNGLLRQGLIAAQRAAEGVSRRAAGPDGLVRVAAHFTCESCHWRDGCDEHAASLRGPVIRGGVRLKVKR